MNHAVFYVEQKLGRELTAPERTRFLQLAKTAPEMVPGDDPVELRPVRRMSFTSGHSLPGVKGGQGHSGAELERDAVTMACAAGLCAAVPLGFAIAQALATASVWIGEHLAYRLFL